MAFVVNVPDTLNKKEQPVVVNAPGPHNSTEQPVQGVPVSNKIIQSGCVGDWFFALKAICACTIVFSGSALLFSFLDEYDEKGTKIKDGTSLESLKEKSYLFGLPILFPLFVWFFFKADKFVAQRSNEGRNLSGRTTVVINGKKVTRMVFSNEYWAGGVTLLVWICFIGSFSVFFSFGIPRCKKKNQELNTGWMSVPIKHACDGAFTIFGQIIIALIIVIGSGTLWYRFYSALPMPARHRKKKQLLRMKASASRKVSQYLGGAVRQGTRNTAPQMAPPAQPAPQAAPAATKVQARAATTVQAAVRRRKAEKKVAQLAITSLNPTRV